MVNVPGSAEQQKRHITFSTYPRLPQGVDRKVVEATDEAENDPRTAGSATRAGAPGDNHGGIR